MQLRAPTMANVVAASIAAAGALRLTTKAGDVPLDDCDPSYGE
jgi:hypothetical protein